MNDQTQEAITRTVAVGTIVGVAQICDPSGSSGIVTGVLGNATYDLVKRASATLKSFIPREIVLPGHPLNDALARAIAKATHLAAGKDALSTFAGTPAWENLNGGEKQLIEGFCRDLRLIELGVVHSSFLVSGVGSFLEKEILESSDEVAVEKLKAELSAHALFGFPESFVQFLYRGLQKYVTPFFWAELIGKDPAHGPWREYISLVIQRLQEDQEFCKSASAEVLAHIRARNDDLRPDDVVSLINAEVDRIARDLSVGAKKEFDSVRAEIFDLREVVERTVKTVATKIDELEGSTAGGFSGLSVQIDDGFKRLEGSLQPPPPLDELIDFLGRSSEEVTERERTLGNDISIPRSELKALLDTIRTQEFSTNLVLGVPGAGKSALFAELAGELRELGISFFGFRADMLPRSIRSYEEIIPGWSETVKLCGTLLKIGSSQKIVVLIDQIDSISTLVDQHPDRLRVVLGFVRELYRREGIHVVLACREFEQKHDPRLAHLKCEIVSLKLPDWGTVAKILGDNGFSIPEEAKELREILRVPLHLRDFLNVATPGEEFDSVQALLEKVWECRVTKHEESDLLEKLARRNLDEEELWAPKAVADGHGETLKSLIRNEILQEDSRGRLIGFRHQAYFDFSLARAFSNSPNFSISEHVLSAGHDGLFVRPLVLSVLSYLRGTLLTRYHHEIAALLGSARWHIKQLVIGLVGAQKSPTKEELQELISLLYSGNYRMIVLRAITGSTGWAQALLDERVFLTQMMSGVDASSDQISGFLASSATQFPEEVASLIREHWLPRAESDHLTCWVLRRAVPSGPITAEVMRILSSRVNTGQFSHMVYAIGEQTPECLPELVFLNLRDVVEKAKADSSELLRQKQQKELDGGDGKEDALSDIFNHNSHLKPIEDILVADLYPGVDLGEIAESHPSAFVSHLWGLFASLIDSAAGPKDDAFPYHYREDSIYESAFELHGRDSLYSAMRRAVASLARTAPGQFLRFANTARELDLMSVHKALASGYVILVESYPQEVFGYLMGDRARLLLGGRFGDEVATTVLLVACAANLSEEDRLSLEACIINFFENDLPHTRDSESGDARGYADYCRRMVVRVLQGFPEGTLSAEGLQRIAGQMRTEPWSNQFKSVGGFVGPRNTLDELEGKTEEELLEIAEELSDETGWDNPDREVFWTEGAGRAGGAIQQSREFAKLAEKDPQKCLKLLDEFQPQRQELYAAQVVEGLARSGSDATEVTSAILSLVDRGFLSDAFREAVTRVSDEIARLNQGLDPRLLSILLGWLATEESPLSSEVQDVDLDDESSLVFGQKSWSCHGGREALISTLARAYACSDPNQKGEWLELIEKRLDIEKNSDVWANTLLRMPWFLKEDPQRVTALVSGVMMRFPGVVLHPAGSRGLSEILVDAKPLGQAELWVRGFEGAELARLKMLAGELYPLLCFHSEWAKNRLWELIDSGNIPDPLLRGLVRAVKWLWKDLGDLKPMGFEVLRLGMCSENVSIRRSASSLISRTDRIVWDEPLKDYLRELRKSESTLLADTYGLTSGLAKELDNAPDEVLQISKAILAAGVERLSDYSTSLPLAADMILQIAVGLHRKEGFREEGLILFEELLKVGLHEAKIAIQSLERGR